jgi:hypothetical protein
VQGAIRQQGSQQESEKVAQDPGNDQDEERLPEMLLSLFSDQHDSSIPRLEHL